MNKMKKSFKNKGCHSILAYRILFLFVISLIINPLHSKNKVSKGLQTVVIDAGHGGKDPGAIVGRAHEKEIVLSIALKLGRYIKEKFPEVRVIFTRSNDIFVPLFERSVIANKNNADLFISIHANYCSTPSVKGTETYVLGLHRTEDNLNVAKKENSVILLEKDYTTRYEGFDPNLSESYIMFELIQDTYIEQSVDFAGILQDSFINHAQRASRDVRQAGFLVLRETAMPGVLIETGYLSNQSEANYLMTDIGRSTLALSIFTSFQLYKEKFDSRLNIASQESKKKPNALKDTAKSDQQNSETPQKVEIPSKEEGQITFAIQLSASPFKLSLNSKIFKGIENITEITAGTYFKYYCLETNSLSKAKKNLSTIKTKIPDAFIIGLKNGQPIPMKEALNTK